MFNSLQPSTLRPAFLGIVITASATIGVVPTARSQTVQGFPDVTTDYWAHPYIQVLNQEGIVAGYPDGTFKPEQVVDRDEFAAIIRQAFDRDRVRTIPTGSVFADVPQNYWAAPPIEEAYETGFMKGYSNNIFKPQQEITKLEALLALARGLNLTYEATKPASVQASAPPPTRQPTATAKARPRAKYRLAFPLAMTAMMQPFIQPAVANNTPPQPARQYPQKAASEQNQPPSTLSAREFLATYYQDVDRIPESAIDSIAAATQAGIVANYPNVKMLEPNQLLNRGGAAALIHQALTYQNKLDPLDSGTEAKQYTTPSKVQ
ncbi:MAG: S-layer homology domain-containing protein [Cyanobacteriota bacterium]|nr:S-layer homology domain-containing protein [Cyanobacteriota bacterium]